MSVFIIQGVRFLVTENTLERDLSFLKIMNENHYNELIKEDAGSDIYGDLCDEELDNGYFMFYPSYESPRGSFIYLALYTRSVYTKHINGSSRLLEPYDNNSSEVSKFKSFLENNGIDTASFGTYLVTVS
jgi:hypothetical protein